MAEERKYKSFWTFYPYYLTEHQDRVCRGLHFIGTSLVFIFFIEFWLTVFSGQPNFMLLLLIPLAGYGFAWFGHFFFEKNKPATFTYPLWSLGSDFVMFWHIITLQMPAKMSEAKRIIEGKGK